MTFYHKIHSFIDRHHLLQQGETVYVALSGGADSVSLLSVLVALGYQCEAMHCNFHLRGTESDRDEAFVRTLCHDLGVHLHVRDFDTTSYAAQHKVSIEMAARDLRYAWFREKAGQCRIAVGHHIDDNAETMLLNLVRGSGLKGLCGMQPENNGVIRPLLCVTRAEILDYLESVNLSYVTDSTNLHDDYSRNRVRLDIIPHMQRINQSAICNIAKTMDNLAEVSRVYNDAIAKAAESCIEKGDGECLSHTAITDSTYPHYIYIHKEKLLDYVSPQSLLHHILSPYGFNRPQIIDILEACRASQSGKMFTSACGVRLLLDRIELILEVNRPEDKVDFAGTFVIDTRPIGQVRIERNPNILYVDADKVQGQIVARRVGSGDTFQPFGMRGRKLVSDYMTDRKFNIFQKETQLLLCDDVDVIWVVNQRPSERYKVDISTKRVLIIYKKN